MTELLVAFLILLGLYLAFKIIHHLIKLVKSCSLLLFVIVLIALVAGKRDLQIPIQIDGLNLTTIESLKDVTML